ncbi:formin-binding protein 1-like isoform X2 [Clavelina lepadiformis]|uniref:formin-binding protein 1-like isoform X2 n=1 Tax=Clavelina lepadiformis TaxID=159417 RepID=UPI00404239C3
MDWGTELWDQFESIDKHHSHGIDFSEKYAKFVKERCSIELEYGMKLRKLAKSFQPKKRDEDRSMFSLHKAFQSQLSEINDIAGQHELVAEEMLSNVSKVCQNVCNDLRIEKKKLYQDGRHLQSVLEQHERTLEQTKKKFEKEWKECERAQGYFEKLDGDGNVTKADVEKAKHTWQAKKDSVEHCKTDYGATLQQFNTDQEAHYSTEMPKVFQAYKDANERRILKNKELMVEFAKIDSKVKPIIQKCLDGMEQAANAIDSKLDSQLVIEKLKSGFLPPGPKEFEDYSSPQQHRQHPEEGSDSSNRNSINLSKQPNRKSGLSWLFGAKKAPESANYSHLPPEQRKKKLQKIIDSLKGDLNKEEDGRKGMMKMQEVYRANPALGDPNSLEPQIKISTNKIEKLQSDLQQHEAWYAEASGSVQSSPAHSMSQRALPEKPVVTTAPLASEPAKSVSVQKKQSLQKEQSFGDDFDEEPEPIGTCVALYDFEATSEGALSMKAGETFTVLEADNGDGWTRAMKNDLDGYVPTSYIEVTFFT